MRSILGILLLVILYGSLYPFNFVWVDPLDINWMNWLVQIRHRTTRGDVLSNFLTFLPLGYFVFICSNDQMKTFRLSRLVKAIAITALFAFSLQILQFFLPSRVPTIGDALINTLGTLAGIGLASLQHHWLARNPQIAASWANAYSIPLFLVVCWALYQLFPFVIEVSANNFNRSLRELWAFSSLDWKQWIFLATMWFCFLRLLETNPWSKSSKGMRILVISGILLAKVLITHNSLTFTELLSVVSALITYELIRHRMDTKLVLGLVVVAILIKESSPWTIKETAANFNFIPFRYYLGGSLWENTQLFLERLFVYGILLYYFRSFTKSFLDSSVSVGLLVILIEILQIYIGDGRPTITEFLMVVFIGHVFRQMSQSETSSIYYQIRNKTG